MHIPHTRLQEEQYEAPVPVIADHAHQARCRNALEPEWEARFEPKSYGFRPRRSCQDEIEVIHVTSCGKTARRVWVLDADLSAAFDRIDHNHLLATIGTFPGRDMIRKWLKAGVFEPGKGFAPTDEGTPQGDVISPLLLNIALHGLEEAAGVRHERSDTRRTKRGSPSLVRYADDMVALCHTRQEAEQVKARLAAWLAPRGLTFNEDKTRIVHLDDGFDFLGFTIRRMRGKLIIKPSKAAIKRVKHRLTTEWPHRGPSQPATGTCGSWPTSGPATATPTSRSPGSSTGTSAGTTRPARTAGYSATATAAPTCPSSPGPPSSGTHSCAGRRPPTTPPKPSTGPPGAASASPCSIPAPCACSTGNTAAARSARSCSCTPTANPTAPRNGSNGTASPARRSPGTTSSPTGGQAHRTRPDSYTPTVYAGQPAQTTNQHLCTPESPQGLLEPYVATSDTYGSEGAPMQQCTGATRQRFMGLRSWRDEDRSGRPGPGCTQAFGEGHSCSWPFASIRWSLTPTTRPGSRTGGPTCWVTRCCTRPPTR